jgi:SAM-dependent methyltransferase
MQAEWDERAQSDAFHYICSERKDWDLESFFQSGDDDYIRLVAPVLTKLGFAAERKEMLEVGCGVGRVTRSFARRFAKVTALDISTEMLERGRKLNKDFHNIFWVQGNGPTFKDIPSNSLDFVFSYLVLQHFPTQVLVLQCVREMVRVLKPGGVFLFQFNGSRAPFMNWKGRLAWGVVDGLREMRLNRMSRRMASVLDFDPKIVGRSWRGAPVPAALVADTLASTGSVMWEMAGEDTPMTWCYGIRTR